MLKFFLVYLFQPNVSFWNAFFSKRNIYQNQLINFPFFLLDRTFHVTLRGEMQLYHLMAAPGAFLSFWCFFFALCLSLIITFVIMSILYFLLFTHTKECRQTYLFLRECGCNLLTNSDHRKGQKTNRKYGVSLEKNSTSYYNLYNPVFHTESSKSRTLLVFRRRRLSLERLQSPR